MSFVFPKYFDYQYPIDVVIYYGNLKHHDGSCSAFVAWMRLRDRAEYISYDDLFDLSQLINKHVIAFGIHFSLEQVKKIKSIARSFILFDYKATILKDEPDYYIDTGKSSCHLAW